MRVVTGDFNGNGRTDIALVRQTPGWGSIPIAFANGDGTWNITNGLAPKFITRVGASAGRAVDRRRLQRQRPDRHRAGAPDAGLELDPGRVRERRWQLGRHQRRRAAVHHRWSGQPGVRLVTGDFNGNGLTDIALVRQTPGWGSIPVAFANGDGNWNITNGPAPQFIPDWAHRPGARLVAGDFIRR